MATLVLTAAGTYFGGPAGGNIGALIGSQIDQRLGVLPTAKPHYEGSRLANLAVQSSTYGEMIPFIYGTVRVAGNVIWSLPIQERSTSSSVGGGKGTGGGGATQTTYSYYGTLAIAIGAGPIDEVIRVWADSKVINLQDYSSGYTFYKGTETQLPDPLMESHEGTGNVPAYRGMAYVVIEDFPLADYGNRIPNFTFEVRKKALHKDSQYGAVEETTTSIIMIPGSGEFVYDTVVQNKITGETLESEFVQSGLKKPINQNNRDSKADALVAVDQLLDTFPNLEWVGLVITWFGDSLDAGVCTIRPNVEYKTGGITEPDHWQVGSFTRATADQMLLDDNDNPIYGGTPSDHTITRIIDYLHSKNIKVMLYPMFFMKLADKPWRGRVTGSIADVANFFTKTDGYNNFILHYANIAASTSAEAFVIGSELIGLTKVKTLSNTFPAVDALVSLAVSVKAIVGGTCKVTYAADWSEYHHEENGWYNLDPLWASPNIDMVGIDAYFPLTDGPQQNYNLAPIKDGWTSGEGYEWYYTDVDRTAQASLSPQYAWKNINWWWNNTHTNPDSSTSAWAPASKPIWFTEYGFPSVDGASNQPNVFYDPNSSEGAFPRFSKGQVDFRIQRACIAATEEQWHGSTMIPNRFLWTWDARPYPFWPDLLDVWTDGGLWKYGHWVNGKFGLSSLAAIVKDICLRAGLALEDIDVSQLNALVDGFLIASQTTARRALEELQLAFFFDALETNGIIRFIPRGNEDVATVLEEEMVPKEKPPSEQQTLIIIRTQDLELPARVNIRYINPAFDYQVGTQHAERQTTQSEEEFSYSLSVVMPDQLAKNIAEVALYNSWQARLHYEFTLPISMAHLEPADVVQLHTDVATHTVRITHTMLGADYTIRCKAVAEDTAVYTAQATAAGSNNTVQIAPSISATDLELLDIPMLPTDDAANQSTLRYAVTGASNNWRGAVMYRAESETGDYTQQVIMDAAATIGTALTALGISSSTVVDVENEVTVLLKGSATELQSVTELQMLNGANLALLGDELIQFSTATLVDEHKYTLKNLLRARLGTEHHMESHTAGERFILLNSALLKQTIPNVLIGLPRFYKPVSIGMTLGSAAAESFTYSAIALKPFAPVHITGTRDGTGNLNITWVRRTRINGEWRDNVDVPLGEESELYEVEIMNGTDVVRTITSLTSPSTSYSAAQQMVDFGAAQSAITLRVYQLSAIIGRGTAAVATI